MDPCTPNVYASIPIAISTTIDQIKVYFLTQNIHNTTVKKKRRYSLYKEICEFPVHLGQSIMSTAQDFLQMFPTMLQRILRVFLITLRLYNIMYLL